MTRSAHVMAQAKINLLLHVLSREASGYHQIETVFLRVDLADRIEIRESTTRTLRCSGPAMPSGGLGDPEQNLAFKAAEAYARVAGWPRGFEIAIEKEIPIGAGLGGGSADAGGVLRALDALSPSPLGSRLLDVAAQIGSDVPFLTIDAPMAVGRGRGEKLAPIPTLQSRYVLIVKPSFGVSTADAYGWLDATGLNSARSALRPPALETWGAIAAVASNDFEPVVASRHPEIDATVQVLKTAGAEMAMMSGSGSAVFGIFSKRPDTAAIAAHARGTIIETRTSDQVVGVVRNQ